MFFGVTYPVTNGLGPLFDKRVWVNGKGRSGLDLRGDDQDLFESFLFVQRFGERKARPGEGREHLGPTKQVLFGDRVRWFNHVSQL